MAKEFCLKFGCDSWIASALVSQLTSNHVLEQASMAAKALFSAIARLESWGVPGQRELTRNAEVEIHSSSRGCGIVRSSFRIVVGSSDRGTVSRLLQG